MEISIVNKDNDIISVKTADGDFTFKVEKNEYEVSDPLTIVQLIKNIWNNSKIKDSNLIIEVTHE